MVDFSKGKSNPYHERIKNGTLKVGQAPRDRIKKYETVVGDILDFIGHPEVFVTDESTLSDFPLEDGDIRDLAVALGIKVSDNDYIADVAERYTYRFEKGD